jgi:hypothetical protein
VRDFVRAYNQHGFVQRSFNEGSPDSDRAFWVRQVRESVLITDHVNDDEIAAEIQRSLVPAVVAQNNMADETSAVTYDSSPGANARSGSNIRSDLAQHDDQLGASHGEVTENEASVRHAPDEEIDAAPPAAAAPAAGAESASVGTLSTGIILAL